MINMLFSINCVNPVENVFQFWEVYLRRLFNVVCSDSNSTQTRLTAFTCSESSPFRRSLINPFIPSADANRGIVGYLQMGFPVDDDFHKISIEIVKHTRLRSAALMIDLLFWVRGNLLPFCLDLLTSLIYLHPIYQYLECIWKIQIFPFHRKKYRNIVWEIRFSFHRQHWQPGGGQ